MFNTHLKRVGLIDKVVAIVTRGPGTVQGREIEFCLWIGGLYVIPIACSIR